ncbi:MAG: hypothetical protein A2340_10050 [Lentisphaerae bacterium RIFOXYB12_FULL_60_10]|nr:MAG: hypothetical protein A2340_10050 [Lentisphaerae bacterium RIFOXYB12_FULL_60_10]
MNNASSTRDVIRAEGLQKSYRLRGVTLDVLRDVNLNVRPGETVAIVGISGAGKSTLLHVLGGLDHPAAGRVWIEGRDVYQLSESRRTALRAAVIGFVFQSYQLLPEMTVLENVLLPAMALGRVRSIGGDARVRACDLLAAVGLSDRLAHRPMELSGGEQQRVALARALMNDPQVILADEPTGNLDRGTGGEVLEYLFTLTRQRGHALVLVTHNETVARTCDRVWRLQAGVLVPDAVDR